MFQRVTTWVKSMLERFACGSHSTTMLCSLGCVMAYAVAAWKHNVVFPTPPLFVQKQNESDTVPSLAMTLNGVLIYRLVR